MQCDVYQVGDDEEALLLVNPETDHVINGEYPLKLLRERGVSLKKIRTMEHGSDYNHTLSKVDLVLRVGDPVWVFNENRRLYPQDANGQPFGSPIFHEHFRRRRIEGETSKAWLVGRLAIPKKTKASKVVVTSDGESVRVFLTWDAVMDEIWLHRRGSVAGALLASSNPRQVAAAAKLLGLTFEDPGPHIAPLGTTHASPPRQED